jgi:hypothetical protein
MQDCAIEEIDVARARGWLDEYDKNMTLPTLQLAREQGLFKETDTNPDLGLLQWAKKAHMLDDFNITDAKHPVNNLKNNATEYIKYFTNEKPPTLNPSSLNTGMGLI